MEALEEPFRIRYESYLGEVDHLPLIMELVDQELSEPYSIFTYRYFVYQWPKLTFLAFHDNNCVGTVVCKMGMHKGTQRGYIAMLVVLAAYRGKHIATTLVTKAINEMMKLGCEEVALEAEVDNKEALALYGRLGFIRAKRLFRYYLNGQDAFRLKLLFPPKPKDEASGTSDAAAAGISTSETGEASGTSDAAAARISTSVSCMSETKSKDQHYKISHPPLPREPYTWLLILDGERGKRQAFYSLTEDRYYIRNFPDFQDKYIACCYGGWVVLKDKFTDSCCMLNVCTMEKLKLPDLHIAPDLCQFSHVVMSSTPLDPSCRIIYFDGPGTFSSCRIGDSKFIQQDLCVDYGIPMIGKNFKGKLHALTYPFCNIITCDLLDSNLQPELVIKGESITEITRSNFETEYFLVDCCDDLLLVLTYTLNKMISNIKVLRADFSSRDWVKLETIGDRAIFLGFHSSSSPASAHGLKSNVVYLVSLAEETRHIYMYDIEENSISMILPCPIVEFNSSLFWLFIPATYNEEKPQDGIFIFEPSRKSHLQLQKVTVDCKDSQMQTHKNECLTMITTNGSLWANLPDDLLLEISPLLYAGDRAVFYGVCRSWHSISSSMVTSQRLRPPLKVSDCSSPLLMCCDNKIIHPIYGKVIGMELPNIPGTCVRAARGG